MDFPEKAMVAFHGTINLRGQRKSREGNPLPTSSGQLVDIQGTSSGPPIKSGPPESFETDRLNKKIVLLRQWRIRSSRKLSRRHSKRPGTNMPYTPPLPWQTISKAGATSVQKPCYGSTKSIFKKTVPYASPTLRASMYCANIWGSRTMGTLEGSIGKEGPWKGSWGSGPMIGETMGGD